MAAMEAAIKSLYLTARPPNMPKNPAMKNAYTIARRQDGFPADVPRATALRGIVRTHKVQSFFAVAAFEMSLLTLANVRHSFGTHVILDGATVSIEQGEKVGLVGRNGSGKTTLMKVMQGQI